MMLWFIMALMTAAAIFAVLWPLSRRTPLATGSDVAVYRDQLDEIERDRTSGLIGEREAEAARIEVSRRLLAAADRCATAGAQDGTTGRRRAAALAALILLPLGAAGLYLSLGSPQLTSQPLEARRGLSPEQSQIMELVARVEAHLEQNPEDGRGWEVIGPVYMRLGRYDDAVRARSSVLRLLGPNATREADLGEAITGAQNGIVTAEAKEAFDRAVKLDPSDIRARYFLGLAAEQDGRPKEAAEVWRALLAEATADAGWAGFVRESLARVDPAARCGIAAGAERGRCRGGKRDVARAAEHDGAQHGGAACRTAEAGRHRRRGVVAAAARLYGAGRQGTGSRRRGRSPAGAGERSGKTSPRR